MSLRLFISVLAFLFTVPGHSSAEFPSDVEIREILRARVDTFKQSVGIVVGVVDSTGSRFVSYGTTHVDGTTPINERTIFEIGSISKVFTSIILADMVRKGEVDFRDPVQQFLPSEVVLPVSEGRVITLGHLATHRSGLPRMPNNFAHGAGSMTAPYPLERMYEFLSTCTLASDIGEKYLYSNLGFGLLAQILANRAGTDLETLLVNRVCDPLGLKDTRFRLSAEQRTRAAGAHDWNHNPTPPLNFDAMMGAGSLRSSATDLLHFVAINAGLVDSPLWSTLQLTHIDREDAIGSRVDVAMGWHTLYVHGREIILHNGATFGNLTFSGFDKEARRGVVVLSNSRGIIDDIGMHLLDPDTKLFRTEDAPETPQAVEIDIEKLRPLEGEYALGPNQIFVVRIEEDKLFGSNNEGIEMELKAISETEFFFEMAPHRITFKKSEKGQVEEIVFSAFGQEVSGKKLEFYRSPVSRVQGGPPDNLDRFVGTYTVDDSLQVKIGREGDGLFVQVEEQLRMALIPTQEGFYAYEARAEFIFSEDSSGEVTGVTIHQDGEHQGFRVQSPASSVRGQGSGKP